ncbi:MAG: aldehyde-activating protein [Deltaproteobacteria bacterium]|nr:aldehyde-activating protein [Deltaproteobacteria bacterium]
MASLRGRCHCGNLELAFESPLPIEQLPVRSCSCSFCFGHGARSISDPGGTIEIVVREPEQPDRYRFGLKTADFLVCKICGVYVAALTEERSKFYAVANANAFALEGASFSPAVSTSFEGETEPVRRSRRSATWTPAALVLTRGRGSA